MLDSFFLHSAVHMCYFDKPVKLVLSCCFKEHVFFFQTFAKLGWGYIKLLYKSSSILSKNQQY